MTDDDPPEDDTEPAPPPEMPSAADAKSLRRQRQKIESAGIRKARCWSGMLDTPIGRLCIWELLEATGWRHTAFAAGPNGFPQPEATWFKAGQAEVGMRLFQSLLVLARANVLTMLDENDPRFAVRK